MTEVFKLFEWDSFYGKPLLNGKSVATKNTIEEAQSEAKKLADAWCEDEKPTKVPVQFRDDTNGELWIGEADFGIMIRKVSII